MKSILYAIMLSSLVACGGGGGGGGAASGSSSSNNNSSGSTPLPQQTAEGIWNGTATPGGAVKMLVRDNGAFYQFFGTAAPAGQIFGTLSVNSSNALTFDTSFGRFASSGTEQGLTVSASTVITNTTLNFTSKYSVFAPRVITQSYDSTYTSPFTLADLAGNYSGASVGQASTFSIDANGNISGNAARYIVNGSCPVTGTITPNASKRYATVSIAGCSDSIDGVGVALLVGSGVGQQIYIGTQSGYGFTMYGVKQ